MVNWKFSFRSNKRKQHPSLEGLTALSEELIRKGQDLIFLSSNGISFDTPNAVKEAAKSALEKGHTGYPSGQGIYELREAIAEKMKFIDKINVSPNQILVTLGAQEAIFLAAQALVDQGDEVITCMPDYPFYHHVEYAGGTTVYLHLKKDEDFKLDMNRLEKLVNKKTKAIMIDSPHNPTGRVFKKDELIGIVEIAEKHDLYLIIDVANEMLIWDNHKHINMISFPGMLKRGATTSSVSKCYGMGGWRVGYIASNEQFIKRLLPLHNMINNVGPPTFVQEGASKIYKMLSGHQSRKPIVETLKKCEEMRDLGFKRLNEMPKLSCHKPEGGGVFLVDITEYRVSTNHFAKFLLKKAKVLIRPADRYNAPGYIRVAFGTPRFPEALDRIENALHKFRI